MLAPELLPVWGGVGTYIVELVRHLPKTIEIHVVAPSRKGLGEIDAKTSDYDLAEYFPDNVHVHLISSASDTFFYNAAFQYACFRHVPRLIKKERIDLIHSHTAHMPDLLLQFRGVKVPTVVTVHTTILGQRRASKEAGARFTDLEFSEKATYLSYPALRLAEMVFFSAKRSYITVSNWMREQLLQEFPNLRDASIRVIQNSVDTAFFRPDANSNAELILFTGRFVAAKGLAFLLQAMPRIISKYPDIKFVFIGPGDSAPYERRLATLQVPRRNFEFLGYLRDRKEMLEYYRKCSIYVAPTLYENLPIRILEAMACGKPVVATSVCGIPEVITSNWDGVLVPPRSGTRLVEAICGLLEDSTRRRQIGRRARETVLERFNWAENALRTARVYEEVVHMA